MLFWTPFGRSSIKAATSAHRRATALRIVFCTKRPAGHSTLLNDEYEPAGIHSLCICSTSLYWVSARFSCFSYTTFVCRPCVDINQEERNPACTMSAHLYTGTDTRRLRKGKHRSSLDEQGNAWTNEINETVGVEHYILFPFVFPFLTSLLLRECTENILCKSRYSPSSPHWVWIPLTIFRTSRYSTLLFSMYASLFFRFFLLS